MIKDLRDARLVDAVPRVVAGQDWVWALSEAVGVLHERTLRYIDDSQIYTSLDTATEPVLDALAINWKVDWYDTGYSVEQKRRIIKTALTVRRLMGTVGAVKLQADAIYPGTMLEEWFEYGGQPGTFRLYINVTDTTEEHPAIIYSPAEMERRLITAKRWSAHLESLSYMVRHTLATGCQGGQVGIHRAGVRHDLLRRVVDACHFGLYGTPCAVDGRPAGSVCCKPGVYRHTARSGDGGLFSLRGAAERWSCNRLHRKP